MKTPIYVRGIKLSSVMVCPSENIDLHNTKIVTKLIFLYLVPHLMVYVSDQPIVDQFRAMKSKQKPHDILMFLVLSNACSDHFCNVDVQSSSVAPPNFVSFRQYICILGSSAPPIPRYLDILAFLCLCGGNYCCLKSKNLKDFRSCRKKEPMPSL